MNQQVATGRSFSSKGAKESVGFIAWGLFILFMIPVFDFVDPHVWGKIVIGVAAVGMIATFAYYIVGNLRAPATDVTPPWAWFVWTMYTAAVGAGAEALSSQVPVAYTVAAALIAVPLLVVGFRLRGKEQA